MEKLQYGNIVLSNIIPFNLKNCFAPCVPMCKSNFVVLMNTPEILPVVRDGKITTRKIMKLGFSYDHRLIDGAQSVNIIKKSLEVFNNPEKYL
jgi:pyruvate/2-oxoglutarate dehydrogenase complex dihydrolipoamide acyltransferase (E2) component